MAKWKCSAVGIQDCSYDRSAEEHITWAVSWEVFPLARSNHRICSCYVRSCPDKDLKSGDNGFCIEIDARHGTVKKMFHLYAKTQLERDEWVFTLRKYAVNTSIENGYEVNRDDKTMKLGSGSYSTVWKCRDKETNKVCGMLYCDWSGFLWNEFYTVLGTERDDEVKCQEGWRRASEGEPVYNGCTFCEMFEFHRKKYVLAPLLDLTTTLFISRNLLKTKIGISLYSSWQDVKIEWKVLLGTRISLRRYQDGFL